MDRQVKKIQRSTAIQIAVQIVVLRKAKNKGKLLYSYIEMPKTDNTK
jgi:hypothetical protein